MSSRVHNIVVTAGEDYTSNVYAYANGSSTTPLDLSTWQESTANAQIKTSYYTANTSGSMNVWFRDSSSGVINLHLSRSNTVSMTPRNYVYDVIIRNVSSGMKKTIISGLVTVKPGVSQ